MLRKSHSGNDLVLLARQNESVINQDLLAAFLKTYSSEEEEMWHLCHLLKSLPPATLRDPHLRKMLYDRILELRKNIHPLNCYHPPFHRSAEALIKKHLRIIARPEHNSLLNQDDVAFFLQTLPTKTLLPYQALLRQHASYFIPSVTSISIASLLLSASMLASIFILNSISGMLSSATFGASFLLCAELTEEIYHQYNLYQLNKMRDAIAGIDDLKSAEEESPLHANQLFSPFIKLKERLQLSPHHSVRAFSREVRQAGLGLKHILLGLLKIICCFGHVERTAWKKGFLIGCGHATAHATKGIFTMVRGSMEVVTAPLVIVKLTLIYFVMPVGRLLFHLFKNIFQPQSNEKCASLNANSSTHTLLSTLDDKQFSHAAQVKLKQKKHLMIQKYQHTPVQFAHFFKQYSGLFHYKSTLKNQTSFEQPLKEKIVKFITP